MREDYSDSPVSPRDAMHGSHRDGQIDPKLLGYLAPMPSFLSGIPRIALPTSLQQRSTQAAAGIDCSALNEHERQKGNEESCSTCLYTGVATCTGLSAYFFKVALMDLPTKGSKEILIKAQKDKRFLSIFGTCWAVAGAYRFYLG